MLRATLSPIRDVDSLAPRWVDALAPRWLALQAAADASFFQSWSWVGCLAAERFSDPVVLSVREGDDEVGLALFNRRRGWLAGETLFLAESGDSAWDSVFIEHNGPLLARAHAAAALPVAAAAVGNGSGLVLSGVPAPLVAGWPAGPGAVDVTRAIRAKAATPVLILSVRDHERSKVEALDAGADDYVTKPFGIQELLARVRAHLRRAPERTTAAIEAGDFIVDPGAHSISVQGKLIHLTPKEFDLLLHLSRHAGKVMTHRALLTAVWGAQSAHQPEYLRVFVGQLRKKLEAETGKQYIQTEPWVGYRFMPEGWTGNEE